ncbi:MAG: AbrB/MazE/SpoVT family DNA-binding domain-containing protein, partial [Thermoplasmata archaeon]|nr:AbrB/MazE/SpoVT family DNA-binding domain-containing protein [Thermoplasmata archaeon]
TVKVGERGQIVIPKEAREVFGIEAGDLLMVMGDENMGMIGITKADQMKAFAMKILAGFENHNDE